MKTYLVFHIVGYDSKLENGEFTNKVVIRLIDTDYENALKRAQDIVEKQFFFLAEVVEFEEGK